MNRALLLLLVLIATVVSAPAQVPPSPPPLLALGDSIGEGVQSADASLRTQPSNFANVIAQQMGVDLALPLIASSPTSTIFSTDGRYRIVPNLLTYNLAVSGATIHDLLHNVYQPPVDTETDLVLEPYTGSQMEIAEAWQSPLNVVWIGSNDVDGAILDWQHLDTSQITDAASFAADYQEMINRLSAIGGRTVVGTIPDVTKIGFVFSPADLKAFTGSDWGLPEGSYTTGPTALLLKSGLVDGSILQDPNYVLDPQEIAKIQNAVLQFNDVIRSTASAAGMAVADIYTIMQSFGTNPPQFYGVALSTRFNGGLLSLDGVHPSNIGHALSANAFIQAANTKFGLNIPLVSTDQLNQIAAADPFIDWDGDLIVRGRPLAGLLETLGPIAGISGDYGDRPGASPVSPTAKVDPALGRAFKARYLEVKGLPANTSWTRADAMRAMQEVFGR